MTYCRTRLIQPMQKAAWLVYNAKTFDRPAIVSPDGTINWGILPRWLNPILIQWPTKAFSNKWDFGGE